MRVPLHCLGGEVAPEGLDADLCVLSRLPERARARFWEALGPALVEPIPASVESSLDAFTRTLEVSPDDLARALKAARYLVREAAMRGLPRERFEDDLVRLAGGARSAEAAEIAPLLLSRYEAARSALADRALRASLADHGAVLRSIEWRVDAVLASSRGDAGAGRIAVLTLGYARGEREEQLTLHLSADKLEELRRACERMSG